MPSHIFTVPLDEMKLCNEKGRELCVQCVYGEPEHCLLEQDEGTASLSGFNDVSFIPGASEPSFCLVSHIYDVFIIKCPRSSQHADHRGAISSKDK